MTLSSLLYLSAYLAGAGVALAVIMAVSAALFIPRSADGKLRIRNGGFLTNSVKYLALGSGGMLAFSIVGFVLSSLWWLFTLAQPWLTPSKLALISLAIGVFPLVLAFSGMVIARLLKGEVDGRGARHCKAAGIDFAPLVEFLYMCHWLVIFTGGLAIWGLGASAIWAFIRIP